MIKFIQDAVNQKPEKKDLIMLLTKNLARYWPERSHKTVHCSDVTKESFCGRQFRLLDVLDKKRPDQYIAAGLKATFDVGNATADLVCNRWAGDHALGHWECDSCGDQKYWTNKPGQGCAKMGKCAWKYKEVGFQHQPSKLHGSIDLMVNLGQTKATAIELKIIKADDFDKLAAPMGEHRARTRLYMRVIRESDSPYKQFVDTQHAKVLYVSRGFGKKSLDAQNQIVPFKEFDVEADDESVQPYIDRAQAVQTSREQQTMLHRLCVGPGDPRAKGCPVKTECFSGAFG